MSLTEQVLSQIPGTPLEGLRKADQVWQNLREDNISIPTTVRKETQLLNTLDWDVVICGGTLGILIGATLVKKVGG